jgi:hypothetical protein
MHQPHLKQQAIIIAILMSLEFNAQADTQKVDDSIANNAVPAMPAPLVVMPPVSTGNAHQTTQSKKAKAAKVQTTTGKQKRTAVKTESVSNANSAANAEKRREADTVAFLKSNQECDSWFDLDGNTSDATAYQQIKNSGYTKSNAPDSVKKQIAEGVAKCNQKYLIARTTKPTTSNITIPPLEADKSHENESKGQSVSFFGKVANGVAQFFSNFRDRNNNSSKHTCSPGEILMHSNGC